MYCKHCGAKIDDKSVFCSVCGEKQGVSEPARAAKPESKAPETVEEIIADFGDDTYGAIKYLSLKNGISMGEAGRQIRAAKAVNGNEQNTKKHFGTKRIIMIGSVLIVLIFIVAAIANNAKKMRTSLDSYVDSVEATKQTMQKTTTTTQPEIVDYTPTEPLRTFSGTGDDVISDISISDYVVVKSNFTGSGHCAIKAHTDYAYDLELLVNETAPYSGEAMLMANDYTFEVNASGKWTIELYDMGYSTSDSFEGQGDMVTPVFTASTNAYEITTVGNHGYFSVKGYYGQGDYDLLVNTTDAYSGKVYFPVKGEYAFFVISGDRKFTIRPAQA